jgi:hypothetical protein
MRWDDWEYCGGGRLDTFKFLCALKITDSTYSMASIGALAALLAIAFDPFAQQLVRTEVGVKYSHDARVQLPIAHRYNGDTMVWNHLGAEYRESRIWS